MNDEKMMPFLKWPGGKRWIVEKLIKNIPSFEGKYIEPFLGSGALFFALKPDGAVLSDINEDLMEVYFAMRDYPNELREKMLYHQKNHCKEYYYKVRATKPRTEINRAARFLYLNRTCRLSENSGKHGVKVWDMVSLSQQNHNGGRRHGVHSRSGSESGNSTAGYPR